MADAEPLIVAEWFKKHAQDIGATLVVVGSERLPKGIKKGGGVAGEGMQWGSGIGVPLGSTALAMLNGVQARALFRSTCPSRPAPGPGRSPEPPLPCSLRRFLPWS